MLVPSERVVVTAAVHDWLHDNVLRTVWIGNCLTRHGSGDWGDLDADDRAANDYALHHARGRLLSAYDVPAELAADTSATTVWVITDDLEDPDAATTILFPSDY